MACPLLIPEIFEEIVPHLGLKDVENLRLVSTAIREMVDHLSKSAILKCCLTSGSRQLYRHLALRYNDRRVTDPEVNLDFNDLHFLQPGWVGCFRPIEKKDLELVKVRPLLPVPHKDWKKRNVLKLRAKKRKNKAEVFVERWLKPHTWANYSSFTLPMDLSQSQVTWIRFSEHVLVTTVLRDGRWDNAIFKFRWNCDSAELILSFRTDHKTVDVRSVLTSKYILLNENDSRLHIVNLTRGTSGQLTRSVDITETSRGSECLRIANCRDQLAVIFVPGRGGMFQLVRLGDCEDSDESRRLVQPRSFKLLQCLEDYYGVSISGCICESIYY